MAYRPPHLPPERSHLTVDAKLAAQKISFQIAQGDGLIAKPPVSADEFYAAISSWRDATSNLLKRIFSEDCESIQFDWAGAGSGTVNRAGSEEVRIEQLKRVAKPHVETLRSLLANLDLYEAPETLHSAPPIPAGPQSPSRNVFVVHGRNELIKLSVARFLEKLDLCPVILHEQADRGRTIIQKFEDHADVEFAVVLLTPDDEGGLRGSDTVKPRARQNVVFELGYFRGRLGPSRVCAVLVEDVEKPSDLDGVLYLPFDDGGAWRLTLARELKAAGIEIDMNRAL